jgi:hypothetical protein
MNQKDQPEEEMTKYAVVEGVDPAALEKAAAKGCPLCGATCVQHGRTLACPVHGTEPFEK